MSWLRQPFFVFLLAAEEGDHTPGSLTPRKKVDLTDVALGGTAGSGDTAKPGNMAELDGPARPDDTGGPDFHAACQPEQSLARAVYLSGHFAPPPLCSGLAACGRCRMRIDTDALRPSPVPAEQRLFSADELAAGWRLGCRHRSAPGMRIELPLGTRLFAEMLADGSEDPLLAHPKRVKGEQTSAESTMVEQATAEQTKNEPTAVERAAAERTAAGHEAAGQTGSERAAIGQTMDERTAQAAFLAVDLGTTSLQWKLMALIAEEFWTLWQGTAVNPQMGAGSDVVSRLSVAATANGRERLGRLTRDALRRLADRGLAVLRAHGLNAELSALCLSANTAMTAITLGLDTRGLAVAPYSLPYAGGQWEDVPGLPRLWTPPQLSPFVGGDIAAGYAALALDPERPEPDYPFLLADLGTNGEFLLALGPDFALAASVALGPALEGIGLAHGVEARPGAISGFSLTPRGLVTLRLPDAAAREPKTGGASASRPVSSLAAAVPPSPAITPVTATASAATSAFPPGITGTGYLSLLHILLSSGAMDRQGHFTPDGCGPLKRFFTPTKETASGGVQGEEHLALPLSLRLTATDVEEILKVKAAFSLGLHRLLQTAGLASRDLARVYVAGALGEHVNKRALEELGFFPQGMENRLEAVGNTSLAGAVLLMRRPDLRPALVQWAAKVKTLDLASDPAFTKHFAEHMRFVW